MNQRMLLPLLFPGVWEEVTLHPDARDSIRASGGDILIVGRTDCRLADNAADDGFEEAMWRCEAFADLGADVVYFEAPEGVNEMRALNRRIREVPTMLAQVEKPGRELLTSERCADLGYDAVLYGLTLLSASAAAVDRALRDMVGSQERLREEEGGGGWQGALPMIQFYNFIMERIANTPKKYDYAHLRFSPFFSFDHVLVRTLNKTRSRYVTRIAHVLTAHFDSFGVRTLPRRGEGSTRRRPRS